jgi:protein phosphatase
MNIQVFSKVGSVRQHNEDSYDYDSNKGIFVIADGMGGHLRGEVASDMAVKTVMNQLTVAVSTGAKDIMLDIERSMLAANQSIYNYAMKHSDHQGMGTTLSVVHFAEDHAYFGHVGDSRVYLFRDGDVTRLTKDHTMVEELVETGTITSEQAKTHPKKNILVKALGTQDGLDVDTGQASVNSGDIIILMTDGVYEYVEEEYLAKLLSEKSLSEVEKIIDKIICDGGAKDNYTLLMVGLK